MENTMNVQERTEFETRLLSIEERLCQLERLILCKKKQVEVSNEN